MSQRYVDIHFRGAAPDWSALPAVARVESHDGAARLQIEQSADVTSLVAIAQHVPEIVSFAYEPPTLSEFLRDAVAA